MYMGNFYMTGNNDEIPPDSNRLNWAFKAPKYVTNAIAANLTVYVTSTDGYIYAVNEETGRTKWEFNTGKPIFAMPVVANGYVVTSSGRKFFCLEEATGKIMWARFDPNYYTQFGTPIIYGNSVIYATRKVIYSRKLKNGHEIWSNNSIETYGGSPVIYEGTIVTSGKSYRGQNSTYLLAIDAKTGQNIWQKNLAHDPNSFTPLVKDGKVYIGSKNYFYKFDIKTGEKEYAVKYNSNFGSEPKYSNQRIYISGTDGYIYIINPEDGKPDKKIQHFSKQGTRFVMVGPNIYTTTDTGKILCIQSDTGKIKWQFQAMHRRRGKILSTANGRAYFTVWDRVYSLSEGALKKTNRPVNTGPIRRMARSNTSPPYRNSRRYTRYRRPYSRYRRPYTRNRYGRDRIALNNPPYSRNRYRRYTPPYRRPYSRYNRKTYRRNNTNAPPYRRTNTPRNRYNNNVGRPERVAIVKKRNNDIVPPYEEVKKPKTKPIKGKLVDQKTGNPIPGYVVAIPKKDKQGKKRITIKIGKDGGYNFKIPREDYDITFRSPGYSFTTIPVKKKEPWKKRIIKLKKLEPGTKFVVNNVFFRVHRATLLPGSIKELRRAVKMLRDNPGRRIEISGHTDSTGGRKYNFYFSRKRAEVVRNFLIKHGISPTRLTIRGAGPDEPIATNKTRAGRAKNRRVEFKVLR